MNTFDLSHAFTVKQQQLMASLDGAKVVGHPGNKGDISEGSWRQLLTGLLPARYQVSSATVVDSRGQASDAIDIVIHDRHFSPLVFQDNGVTYVPAESVYAVFECKPKVNKEYLEYASAKAESVRRLHRTSAQIVHAGGVIAKPKPPPEILTGLLATHSGWTTGLGGPFRKQLATTGPGRLDLGCVAGAGGWEVPTDPTSALRVVPAERSLVFLAMRLLARQQQMGTIPAMDFDIWSAPLLS